MSQREWISILAGWAAAGFAAVIALMAGGMGTLIPAMVALVVGFVVTAACLKLVP